MFFSNNAVAKVAGRTSDLSFVNEPQLSGLPAGLERRGHPERGSLRWTSDHASLVISHLGGCLDGVNTQGLAGHTLMYTSAGYEPPDSRPALATTALSYVPDTFANVADAVEGLKDVRVVPVPVRELNVGLHLALEDASADSAFIDRLTERWWFTTVPSTGSWRMRRASTSS